MPPFAVRLFRAASLAAFALPAAAQTPPAISTLFSDTDFTGHISELAERIDTNGDGLAEVLVTSRYRVSLVQSDTSARGHREIARLTTPDGIFHQASLVGAGNQRRLAVAWTNRLQLFDLRPGLPLFASTATVNWADGLGYGDVDGDGQSEIVFADPSRVELFDPVTLASRGSLWLDAGRFALADIHGDARAEIVADNGKAYTLDRSGETLTAIQVWSTPPHDMSQAIPHAVDVDDDGNAELVTRGNYSATLHRFRPVAGSLPLSSLDILTGITFADVNGDGRKDMLVADGSHRIAATDLATGSVLWTRELTYGVAVPSSPTGIAAVDLDGDGGKELLWSDMNWHALFAAPMAPVPAGALLWHSYPSPTWGYGSNGFTLVRHTDGTRSIAVLEPRTSLVPHLSTIGLRDATTFADRGGTSNDWLPDFSWQTRDAEQLCISTVRMPDGTDRLVVGGDERPSNGSAGHTPRLWIFDDRARYLGTLSLTTAIEPRCVAGERVLAGAPPHVAVAGLMGPYDARIAVVQLVDLATGGVLWQSEALPASSGSPVSQLVARDLDRDGNAEVLVSNGSEIAVFTPALGTSVRARLAGGEYSVLDATPTSNAKVATLTTTPSASTVSVFDAFATTAEKTFNFPTTVASVTAFRQAPSGEILLLLSDYGFSKMIRYDDGHVFEYLSSVGARNFEVSDLDGDNRVELISDGGILTVLRIDNDYLFRNGYQ